MQRLVGDTSRQRARTNQKDVPCQTVLHSAIKSEKRGVRDADRPLLGNWLGIPLPLGGGEWLHLHHLSLFSFSLLPSFPHEFNLSPRFLAFALPLLFLHPLRGEGSEQRCGVAAYWG